jgi:hypothetical protein
MRPSKSLARLWLVVLVLATGACMEDETGGSYASPSRWAARRLVLPAGTSLDVRLASRLHSQIASPGDSWTGVLIHPVVLEGRTIVPAGTYVHGNVMAARKPNQGDGAMLDLAIRSVSLDGKEIRLDATADEVLVGSATFETASLPQAEPLVLTPGTLMTFTIEESLAVRYP